MLGDMFGKCQRCGKIKLSGQINIHGYCKLCAEELQKEADQREQEFQARQKKLKAESKAEFEQVCALPRFDISRSGQPMKAQSTTFLKDLAYTNITSRSSLEKLGRFIVLDTETTGLSSVRDDVIEISAIKVEDWKPIEIFSTFVKPKHGLNDEAQKVNHITEEMVEDAPMLYEIMPSLQEFIAGYNLIGHNLEFDLRFLCRGGLDITSERRKFYDTMQISKHTLKAARGNYDSDYDVEDYKLDTLCDWFRIFRADAHRALGDCWDTMRLFYRLANYRISY